MEDLPLVERDVSWLHFNERVLQEAEDNRVPLFERIKFLAIYSSNLDEYFRVRVASLRSFKQLKKKTRKSLSLKPKKQLRQIRKLVEQQQNRFGRVFREEILPLLADEGIHMRANEEYSVSQYDFTQAYFNQSVRPVLHLQPLATEGNAHPFLKNRSLYFVTRVHPLNSAAPQYWLIDIPSDELSRFIVLPSAQKDKFEITFLDDIIRCHVQECFELPLDGIYSIKLSRDAELYIDDEFEGDLLEKLKNSLDERNVGLPTRFLYDSRMPDDFLKEMRNLFDLKKDDLIPGARYHNFNDFFSFPDPVHRRHLHDVPLPPLEHPELANTDSLIDAIQQKDYLLNFPYQKYDYVIQLIEEASQHPEVTAIKITLYRVAGRSAVMKALIKACQAGKKVTVFVEAKARFDEESNLYWGNELQAAGASVFYSYPGIKVHTKLLLIEMDKEGPPHSFFLAYLGTGNFNEKTAKLYCDHALLTAEQQITTEVNQVFALLERRIILPKCKTLLVSPFSLRARFISMIDEEIALARQGKKAYMILKMNSLEDPEMISKLYQASQAGVEIHLIVRGICSLIPGLEGWSEHIEGISIVDRFLEHARIYIFGNGGKEKMYLASADWMTRNLDRRVEVAFPILDKKIAATLRKVIDLQLSDNTKARILESSWQNLYKSKEESEPSIRAQTDTYNYFKNKILSLSK